MSFFRLNRATDQKKARRQFQLELLEDRCVPATLLVNVDTDGAIDFSDTNQTLREAISIINNPTTGNISAIDLQNLRDSGLVTDDTNGGDAFGINDTILFDASLNGDDILIGASGQGTQLSITSATNDGDVTIDAAALTDGIIIDGENNNRVFDVSGAGGIDVTFNNLTIQNGAAGAGNGGGILAGGVGNVVNILNSVMTGNSATRGGGVYNNGARVEIDHSNISSNTANEGGGVFNNYLAGGINLLNITNSIVSMNTSNSYGGGIMLNYDTVSFISNTTISHNEVLDGEGGGIRVRSADLTILNSTINDNLADVDGSMDTSGGGILTTGGRVHLFNSTVSGNRTGGQGGGIFAADRFYIVNSTITNNTADADNDENQGGGVYTPSGNVVRLFNSIIAGNFDRLPNTDFSPDLGGNQFITNGFNIIGDSAGADLNGPGTDLFLSDLGIALSDVIDLVLSDNGGATLTHALVANSVAIDAGNNADADDVVGDDFETDQRGVGNGTDRFLNGIVDIGAVEYAVGFVIASPQDGLLPEGIINVMLENVFDQDDSPDINTVENSIQVTNGTVSNFVDNGDGTATFDVTPIGNGEVIISAYNDTVTLTPAATGQFTVNANNDYGAFTVDATPDDGMLTLEDINVTNGTARNLMDNGDGTFSFTVAPNAVGTVELSIDGIDGLATVNFQPLTYGNSEAEFVRNLYLSLFEREPSDDEVNYWVGRMTDEGLTIRQVMANFFASDEFQGDLSNAGVIEKIYQTLFDRDPSEAEVEFWTDNLAIAGDDPALQVNVFLKMLMSDEASTRFAEETYNLILQRPSDEAGLSFWADDVAQFGVEPVQQGMAETDEGQAV